MNLYTIRNSSDNLHSTISQKKSIEQRMHEKTKDDEGTGCKIWTGASVPAGYGVTFYEGKQQYAHRVSWKLFRGAIQDGMNVLHKCDRPACVNVDHLFVGTQLDNVHDMMNKGRAAFPGFKSGDQHHVRLNPNTVQGTNNGNAKLTDADVLSIRSLYEEGHSQSSIASKFAIRQGSVSRILRRTAWVHI